MLSSIIGQPIAIHHASDWNEEAADLLSELYAEIATCSAAMDLVPRPPGFKPGWGWLVSYVHQALAARMTGSQKIYEACMLVGSLAYISAIEIALMD